jgi:hypothetical protein
MNAPWHDPYRRELLIAAAAALVWALLGVAITARGQTLAPPSSQVYSGSLPSAGRVGEGGDAGTRFTTPPHQGEGNGGSCRIHNHLSRGSTNIGSGTLVDVTPDRRRGLVLTCAHLFTEGRGRVIVEFASGRTHGANVLAVDPDADLAALEIADPQSSPAPLGIEEIDVAPQGPLTACGFGSAGQYRCIAGRVIGTTQDTGQLSVRITGAVRSGDSGGGVFDAQGRLVAVVWGESGGVTYASTGVPLRRFLERVLGNRASMGQVRGANPLPTMPLARSPLCPDGRCPLLQPAPLVVPPADRGPAAGGEVDGGVGGAACGTCNCGDQLAALAARLDALDNAKQDRGDYLTPGALAGLARTDEVALFDQQNRQRHDSLLQKIENLAPLLGAAGRVAAPFALTALGISGPLGWSLLAATSIGGVLLGRWMRLKARATRREAREKNQTTELAPRASQLATAAEATAAADHSFRAAAHAETQQPIERDDREARELLRLSQLEGRDPLQDALAGRLALDRLDAAADGDADPHRARWADDLRRELRERFNDVAPTKFQVRPET